MIRTAVSVRVSQFLLAAIVLGLAGCFVMRPNRGGAQVRLAENSPRRFIASDIAVPAGYRIEPVATELTYPTGVAFDDRGRMFVVESGYSYSEDFTTPRLLRIENGR